MQAAAQQVGTSAKVQELEDALQALQAYGNESSATLKSTLSQLEAEKAELDGLKVREQQRSCMPSTCLGWHA
jgi:hypothetical protein